MEQKKDYFSLVEVAAVFGQSVEAIKDKIFEGCFLTPSYFIKNPLRSGFYTEVQTQADKENGDYGTTFRFVFGFRNLHMISKPINQPLSPYVSTIEKALIFDSINSLRRRQQSPFNANFTGIVDIWGIQDHRHSGEFDGKIQLHLNYGRRPVSHSRLFRLRLIYLTQSGVRVELVPLEPREISEDKLIVRRENFINAIANDDEAMEHFEQLERLREVVLNSDSITSPFNVPQAGKNTSPITLLLKAFLDESFASHSKTSFYEYVKHNLQGNQPKKRMTILRFQ